MTRRGTVSWTPSDKLAGRRRSPERQSPAWEAADAVALPLCPFGDSVTAAAAAMLAAAVSAPVATRRTGRLRPAGTATG